MIYLLRHGEAEDGDGDDSARRLTPKGKEQARNVGLALTALGAKIDACLASPRGAATSSWSPTSQISPPRSPASPEPR